jgi:FAD binding domain
VSAAGPELLESPIHFTKYCCALMILSDWYSRVHSCLWYDGSCTQALSIIRWICSLWPWLSARLTENRSFVDVLVIGAGPTGSMCAQGLARAGVSVRIIDKKFEPVLFFLKTRFNLCKQTVPCYPGACRRSAASSIGGFSRSQAFLFIT